MKESLAHVNLPTSVNWQELGQGFVHACVRETWPGVCACMRVCERGDGTLRVTCVCVTKPVGPKKGTNRRAVNKAHSLSLSQPFQQPSIFCPQQLAHLSGPSHPNQSTLSAAYQNSGARARTCTPYQNSGTHLHCRQGESEECHTWMRYSWLRLEGNEENIGQGKNATPRMC